MPNRFALAWRALTRPDTLVDAWWLGALFRARESRDRYRDQLRRIRAILDETDERRPR